MMNDQFPSRRAILALIGALALGACGRKADPKPPPDADPEAPRTYPVDRRRRDEAPPLPPPDLPPLPTPIIPR